jgi:hypothetical protein
MLLQPGINYDDRRRHPSAYDSLNEGPVLDHTRSDGLCNKLDECGQEMCKFTPQIGHSTNSALQCYKQRTAAAGFSYYVPT